MTLEALHPRHQPWKGALILPLTLLGCRDKGLQEGDQLTQEVLIDSSDPVQLLGVACL